MDSDGRTRAVGNRADNLAVAELWVFGNRGWVVVVFGTSASDGWGETLGDAGQSDSSWAAKVPYARRSKHVQQFL